MDLDKFYLEKFVCVFDWSYKILYLFVIDYWFFFIYFGFEYMWYIIIYNIE